MFVEKSRMLSYSTFHVFMLAIVIFVPEDNMNSHFENLTEDTSFSDSSFSSDMETSVHSTLETDSVISNFGNLTEGTTSGSSSFSSEIETTVYPTVETGRLLNLCPVNLDDLRCTCKLLLSSNGTGMCSCSEAEGSIIYEGSTCMWLPQDCNEIGQNGVTQDGIYTIYPSGNDNSPFNVYCRMTEEGGWTVIQRRSNGLVDFSQDFETYAKGFGSLNEEFWLGNEKLFRLTSRATYTLRIDMVFDGGTETFAEYDAFKINDANDNFRLVSLGFYNGPLGGFDAMALSLSMGFTTFDHDVDFKLSHNCASTSGGGWWYNGGNTGWCYHANLNGIYGDERIQSAIIWYIGSGFEYKYLVKSVEMKIRPT